MDIDNQHRGSIIGEIIGSFMAGVVIATVIIMLTGELTIEPYNIVLCSYVGMIESMCIADWIWENIHS